jgi:hypothetical protein
MFSRGAMGVRRKVVLLGGSPVFLVRGFLLFVGHEFPPLRNGLQASCILFRLRRIAIGVEGDALSESPPCQLR